MKVGSLVFATQQGLGILAKSFYDAGVVTDVLIVKHSCYPTRQEWYPGSKVISGRPFDMDSCVEFIKNMDVMLFFETPFQWELFEACRRHNTKIVLMPMYECEPRDLPDTPDLMLCPSLLDLDYYMHLNSLFIPVPVDAPWRERHRALTFVHNAGHGGLNKRNGTELLLTSMDFVKSPIKLLLRTQGDIRHNVLISDKRIELVTGTVPYSSLYSTGDVFIFPEKFNGLSLPLQEAFASGMMVMAGNRFPMNSWLPTKPLIPVDHYEKGRISGRMNEYQEAIYTPKDIAETIDKWYNRDITEFSKLGLEYAQQNSWEALKPLYMEALASL